MAKLVECIPNFSEGRRKEVIEAIADAIRSVKGVRLLDFSSDESHNRSVFTFVGDPDAVKEAAFASASKAAQLIDMTKHKGEHPRMGAVDVIPFVPVKGITMEECVQISREVGERIAGELSIPVFLYEESATRPERKNLADIRRGEFEGMAKKIKDPAWAPDFGKPEIHPTAGAVAVGARMPLIAYNVNLNTSDVNIAKNIAKVIRESGGGLKNVKAIGVMLEDRNIAQVSMNMTNYEKTALYRAFELIRIEARRYGVDIIGSEIVGITPMKALIDVAKYYLQLENFDDSKQILENYLIAE
ncbi:glutamate formimidoyltransferase [Thermosediminibacter oceani]|uniref:glutamate formimidoyltransferase n=1 Tax=Thermosediminibacter oceani (strain ATCC BAA-1034 / DSM 16646 / JW/IW-1228P) TaxID=555079 RepID=D9RXZ9_THEOJ|nr:glutamate formimidoyltransferase [Thermosediminibacter oceani]ADL08223.1 glutamate formiminotransferase [Thermosediminibacter oceani DSM 16646]